MNDRPEVSRRRRTTRHLLFSGITVALFAVALFWLSVASAPAPQPTPTSTGSPAPTPTPDPVQPTVLVQVSGARGATVNLLTAVGTGRNPEPALISLPSELMVSAPGAAAESIRATVSSIDTLRAGSAVSATLGVRVDGSWRMDRKALSGLVDVVGGMTVTAPELLRVRNSSGKVVLRLKPGPNKLTGAQASWYAVGLVRGSSTDETMHRGSTVLHKAIRRLPDSTTSVREILTSLGALAPTTIAAQDLAEYLVQLREEVRQGADVVPLPTTSRPVGRTDYRWTAFGEATPLLRRLLPLAQWSTRAGQQPRVLVMQSTAEPGMIGSARRHVEQLGFVFVDGRGTAAAPNRDSIVRARGRQPWGGDVAEALGLPTDSVASSSGELPARGRPWADVDVILGPDYTPTP